MRVDLWLDSDDIASANQSGFEFQIPDDAVRKGNLDDPADEKAKASWTQKLDVVESKFYEDETKGDNPTDCVVAEIVFQVPSNALRGATADPNAGKQLRVWYRVVPAALKNKNHAKYKANNFAIGKLSSCARAVWGSKVFPHGAKINFGEYFGGEPAPVVGNTVTAHLKAYKYNGNRKDEITDFIPLELV
jgi:hypothetical protein